eukprot:5337053-Pyramimonas_sp.AAC.1
MTIIVYNELYYTTSIVVYALAYLRRRSECSTVAHRDPKAPMVKQMEPTRKWKPIHQPTSSGLHVQSGAALVSWSSRLRSCTTGTRAHEGAGGARVAN